MANQPKKDPSTGSNESFFHFLMNNKLDTLAYILLFCGLLLALFQYMIGGLLVGIILGLYFSQELGVRATQFKEYIVEEGVFRGFVLIAGVLALFIASPQLCVGTLVGAYTRHYLP